MEPSGYKVGEAPAALTARPAVRWLDGATWWPSQRPQSQATFLFWFGGFSGEGFLSLFPAGLRDYQNPLPSNRILLR